MKPSANNILRQPLRPAQPQQSSAMDRQIAVTNFNAGRFADTEQFSRKLTAAYPNDGFGWKILGVSLFKLGRLHDALEPLKKAALMMPQDWEAFGNLGAAYMALGDLEHATACMAHALELNPRHIDSLSNMAELCLNQGRRQEALAYYQRKAELLPEDGYTAHLVAMLSGAQTTQTPAGYITQLFDSYAQNFDTHLASKLKYDVPAQLAALVQGSAAPAAGSLDILDLGCGTGLSGEPFVAMARSLVGVDLSSGMLALAQKRGIYQRLLQTDVLSALKAEPDASFDLILSADVYNYVGELDAVAAEVRRVLRPGGLHAFSIEESTGTSDRPVHLGTYGRYSHAPSYLKSLAEPLGFRILKDEAITLRLEGDAPLAGRLQLWG